MREREREGENLPYSQKNWLELNLAMEPKIAIFKFGGSVRDCHTYNNNNNMRIGNFGGF